LEFCCPTDHCCKPSITTSQQPPAHSVREIALFCRFNIQDSRARDLGRTFTGTRKGRGMQPGTDAFRFLTWADSGASRSGHAIRYCPLPGIAELRTVGMLWTTSRSSQLPRTAVVSVRRRMRLRHALWRPPPLFKRRLGHPATRALANGKKRGFSPSLAARLRRALPCA
jgi:hypothetical protein